MSKDLSAFRLFCKEEFQYWLARNEDLREELEALAGFALGVDTASLDALEAFLLARFPDVNSALGLEGRGILDAASRQVGLILLLNVDGGEWAINLEKPRQVYHSLPVIRFPNGDEACPLSLASACLDRRTGVFLRSVVEAYEEDFNGAPPRLQPRASASRRKERVPRPRSRR